MSRKVMCVLMLLVVTMTITLLSCKPMEYYFERVYKAYGTVTEAETGVPLESVEVYLGSYQYSELSNGLGDYELELAEGTWTLTFAKEGYTTLTVSNITVGPTNKRVNVDAALTPEAKPAPEFAGTWAVTLTSPIQATITWTLTSTTLHSVIDAGTSGSAILDGNISGIDETLNHFIVTYTAVTNTGGFVAYEKPDDFVYVLYDLAGNALTVKTNTINVATFPTDTSVGALTLTKVP